MAVIIIPRRHYTQPQGRVAIDWNTALTDGLVHAALNGIDAVSGAVAVTLKSNPVATKSGIARSFSGVSGSFDDFEVNFSALGAFSLGALWSRRVAATQRIVAWSFQSATRGATLSPDSSGNIRAIVAGIGTNTILVGAQTSTDDEYASTLTFKEGGLTLIHGSDAISTVSPHTSVSFQTGRIRIGADDPNTSLLNGLVGVSAAWARELSVEESKEWNRNPWQLFRTDPIRIYSLPSGPISISWSSLTASNITQTGATLTLGGIVR